MFVEEGVKRGGAEEQAQGINDSRVGDLQNVVWWCWWFLSLLIISFSPVIQQWFLFKQESYWTVIIERKSCDILLFGSRKYFYLSNIILPLLLYPFKLWNHHQKKHSCLIICSKILLRVVLNTLFKWHFHYSIIVITYNKYKL